MSDVAMLLLLAQFRIKNVIREKKRQEKFGVQIFFGLLI